MRYRSTLFFVALVATLLVVPAEAGKKKQKKNTLARPHEIGALDGPVTLANVNERWQGAATRTRVNIPIQKGKVRGWSSSEWLGADSEVLRMRFSVGPRDELGEVLPRRNLLAGVTLICEGWSVQRPKKGKGVVVDFRFANYPARARAEFDTDIEHLAEVERFLRANVLGLTRYATASPDAAEVASDESQPSQVAVPEPEVFRPLPAVETYSAEATSYPAARGLRIGAVEVQPAKVRRGAPVELRIRYEVSAGDDSIVRVHESRTLQRGAIEIGALDESVDRAPGGYTSATRFVVPENAIPGIYSYRASVSFEEMSDEFTALFEVE